MRRQTVSRALQAVLILATLSFASSCKDVIGTDWGKPVSTPVSATVTLGSSRPDPSAVFLRPGGQLILDNRNGIARQLVSPCSEVNVLMAAGTRRTIQMPSQATTCTYHDEADSNYSGYVRLCSQLSLFGCQ